MQLCNIFVKYSLFFANNCINQFDGELKKEYNKDSKKKKRFERRNDNG